MSMIHESPAAEDVIVVALNNTPMDGRRWWFFPDLGVLAVGRRIDATTLSQALTVAGVR